MYSFCHTVSVSELLKKFWEGFLKGLNILIKGLDNLKQVK
jgi:hypothetical protein